MAKHSLKKERWTLTFDPELKEQVQQKAKQLRVYPVQLLENLVREKLNPYGFQSVRDSVAYVNSIRKQSNRSSDKQFIQDLKKWQKK